jgi:hypothetical protein
MERAMSGFKHAALSLAGAVALAGLPITPAAAAGPLLFAPLALGHVLGAMARLATLPLISAAQFQAPAPAGYPAAPAYAAGPQGYYPPAQGYYPPAPAYYPPVQSYYPQASAYYAPRPVYYPPSPRYAPASPRFERPARGDYAPYARYAGSYAPHVAYRSGGYGYRRR